MLLILFVFIAGCVWISIYAFREIVKCEKKVKDTQKLSHRVIIKVELERKTVEIHSFLGFGFFVALLIAFMFFSISKQIQSDALCCFVSVMLILVPILFFCLLIKAIQVDKKISDL